VALNVNIPKDAALFGLSCDIDWVKKWKYYSNKKIEIRLGGGFHLASTVYHAVIVGSVEKVRHFCFSSGTIDSSLQITQDHLLFYQTA
jgi:hypothetical protein